MKHKKDKSPWALIARVHSLAELFQLAHTDDKYRQLLMISAQNLGGDPKTVQGAEQWLRINAMETSEEGVVEEINFCRDLVQ